MSEKAKMNTLKIDPSLMATAPKPVTVQAAPTSAKKHIQIRDLSADKHREVKAYAAERGLSMGDLMMTAYEFYKANHP
ncbi:hypothetical protein ACLPJF_27550 [Pseudomonas vlassakiae]|jgi:NRPS condensation-like uncharacterized protein|uniref:hypothetical protein n=1 Tax=Pseudomonas vlassakiae TaxID=485888 RepID=UPI003D2D041B